MNENRTETTGFRLPVWVAAGVFLLIAAYYLWTEHRAHLVPWLPFVILLACPLIHVFMHRGHGGHHGRSEPR